MFNVRMYVLESESSTSRVEINSHHVKSATANISDIL